jgi:hypothetical protein
LQFFSIFFHLISGKIGDVSGTIGDGGTIGGTIGDEVEQ